MHGRLTHSILDSSPGMPGGTIAIEAGATTLAVVSNTGGGGVRSHHTLACLIDAAQVDALPLPTTHCETSDRSAPSAATAEATVAVPMMLAAT